MRLCISSFNVSIKAEKWRKKQRVTQACDKSLVCVREAVKPPQLGRQTAEQQKLKAGAAIQNSKMYKRHCSLQSLNQVHLAQRARQAAWQVGAACPQTTHPLGCVSLI